MRRNNIYTKGQTVFFIVLVLFLFVSAVVYYFGFRNGDIEMSDQHVDVQVDLDPRIEEVLEEKRMLVKSLAENETLIQELEKISTKNAGLSKPDISEIENEWMAADEQGGLVESYLTNKVALLLVEFQEENLGFSEVFATDMIGLNVGMTNKTSDLFQADEKWWVGAYDSGLGKSYHGDIEYDESSRTEAISLYMPVKTQNGTVIGIIKAVLDVTQIKREL